MFARGTDARETSEREKMLAELVGARTMLKYFIALGDGEILR